MKSHGFFLLLFLLTIPLPAQVIYEQADDGNAAYHAGYFIQSAGGIYTADDFLLEESASISAIKVYGMEFSGNLVNTGILEGFNFYIYKDKEGNPAGNPSVEGSGVFEISLSVSDGNFQNGLEIDHYNAEDGFPNRYDFTLNINEAIGHNLSLPAGHYWLVAAAQVDLDATVTEDLQQEWSWIGTADNGGQGIRFITPEGLSVATEWVPAGDQGLAFTLFGESLGVVQQHNPTSLILYPNPVKDKLHLIFSGSSPMNQIVVTDVSGKAFPIRRQGNTIDTANWDPGIYFVRVMSRKRVYIEKIIKY